MEKLEQEEREKKMLDMPSSSSKKKDTGSKKRKEVPDATSSSSGKKDTGSKKRKEVPVSDRSSMELSDAPSSSSGKKVKVGALEKFGADIIGAMNTPIPQIGPPSTLYVVLP